MGFRCSRGSWKWLATAVLTLAVAPSGHAAPGELDVRFGTHGQTEVPAQVDSAALIPLPDGRILVFGVPEDRAARDDGAIAVARLLANGEPDTAFAPGGHLDLRLGGDRLPVPTDALLLADGRILVAGYFEGATYVHGHDDRLRSPAAGWLVRLSSDASIDPTFAVGGVARVGALGVDRIAVLFDGAIAAAGPGVLHRLDANGVPAAFPGSALTAVPIGTSYPTSAIASLLDGAVITSAGFSGAWDSWELSRVSVSGAVVQYWAWHNLEPTFGEVASFVRHADGSRVLACGSKYQALVVQRWQSDGTPDTSFARVSGGRVHLAVDARPSFREWRAPRCRRILADSTDGHVVVGDWSKPYELGGGRVVVARLDASGAVDAAFDRTGNGRELALGTADQWSSWYVADADTAPDGTVLLIARRTSEPSDNPYYTNELSEQRTLIARVEISPSLGVGSIGFNDAALRVAERQGRELRVHRSGGTSGRISVRYELLHDTTTPTDIASITGTLTWPDGDAAPRTIALAPVDDAVLEGEERFRIRLSEPSAGAGLAAPDIEVTIEDDEALRGLQFAEPLQQIDEAESATVTIAPLAAAPAPIVVHYLIAPDLDPNDGAARPTEHTYLAMPRRVGELRWSSGDTSTRSLQVSTFGDGNTRPQELIYVALADAAGTLRSGGAWHAARITVDQNPSLQTGSSPAPVPTEPTQPVASEGGGGAVSLELLLLLALALWMRRQRWVKPNGGRATRLITLFSIGAVLTGCGGSSAPTPQPQGPINPGTTTPVATGTGTLTVSVVDPEGRPLRDAAVSVYRNAPATNVGFARTGTDGLAALAAVPGDTRVHVTHAFGAPFSNLHFDVAETGVTFLVVTLQPFRPRPTVALLPVATGVSADRSELTLEVTIVASEAAPFPPAGHGDYSPVSTPSLALTLDDWDEWGSQRLCFVWLDLARPVPSCGASWGASDYAVTVEEFTYDAAGTAPLLAAQGPAQSAMLVLDQSGRVVGLDPEAMRSFAARTLIARAVTASQPLNLSVAGFAGDGNSRAALPERPLWVPVGSGTVFSTDRAALEAAVASLEPLVGGAAPVLEALEAALALTASQAPPGNRAIVALLGGGDDGETSDSSRRETLAALRQQRDDAGVQSILIAAAPRALRDERLALAELAAALRAPSIFLGASPSWAASGSSNQTWTSGVYAAMDLAADLLAKRPLPTLSASFRVKTSHPGGFAAGTTLRGALYIETDICPMGCWEIPLEFAVAIP